MFALKGDRSSTLTTGGALMALAPRISSPSHRLSFLFLALILLVCFVAASTYVDTSHPLVEESPTLTTSIKEHSVVSFRNPTTSSTPWPLKSISWIMLFPQLLLSLTAPSFIYLFLFIPLSIRSLFLIPIKFTSTFVI